MVSYYRYQIIVPNYNLLIHRSKFIGQFTGQFTGQFIDHNCRSVASSRHTGNLMPHTFTLPFTGNPRIIFRNSFWLDDCTIVPIIPVGYGSGADTEKKSMEVYHEAYEAYDEALEPLSDRVSMKEKR